MLRMIRLALALVAFVAPAQAQLLPWPAALGGSSASGNQNARAFAWYGLDDTNSMSANTTAANTFAQFVQSGTPGLNELMDTAGLFAYSSANSEICYSGGASTFLVHGEITVKLAATTGATTVYGSFGVGATPIAVVAGSGDDDWTHGRHAGTDTAGASSEILLPIAQAVSLTNGSCIRVFGACSVVSGSGCDPTMWAASIMIEEMTSQQALLLGRASVTALSATTDTFTTDELSGGVVQKTLTGAVTVTLGGSECTAGKHVTVTDAFGTGAITIDIPSGFQVEEITNNSGNDIASTAAYGESISLLCTGSDANGNGDLDILVIGQKGSWSDATPP